MATSGGQNKGFQFKMSKKVAELTQVVHMLFTRNHEKEVELEATKDAYEKEIANLIYDAQQKLERKDKDLKELKLTHDAELKLLTEKLLKDRTEKQAEEKLLGDVTALNKELDEEKKEGAKVRDLLIAAEEDIKKLKELKELERKYAEEQTNVIMEQLNKLRLEKSDLEKQKKSWNNEKADVLHQLQGRCKTLDTENAQLKVAAAAAEKVKEKLEAKVKQLENEMRLLKKELFNKKPVAIEKTEVTSPPSASVMLARLEDYHEEMQRLRHEVTRYKNELYNRENNFNRMFSDQQPVLLGRKGSLPAAKQGTRTPVREKAFAFGNRRESLDSSYQDPARIYPFVADSRLPLLNGESRSRPDSRENGFLRPTRTSRELLYSRESM